MQQSLQHCEVKIKHNIDTLSLQQRKLQSLERIVSLKDVTIVDLNMRLEGIDLATHDGTFIWRMFNFLQRRQEAIDGRTPSIYSSHFYTSRHGKTKNILLLKAVF